MGACWQCKYPDQQIVIKTSSSFLHHGEPPVYISLTSGTSWSQLKLSRMMPYCITHILPSSLIISLPFPSFEFLSFWLFFFMQCVSPLWSLEASFYVIINIFSKRGVWGHERGPFALVSGICNEIVFGLHQTRALISQTERFTPWTPHGACPPTSPWLMWKSSSQSFSTSQSF